MLNISTGNLNLLEGGKLWPDMPKISFRNCPVSSINSGHTNIYINEPFGLGRFATDHSLTKAASRPLFVRVRRYAPQTTNLTRPCFSITNELQLGYYNIPF